MSKADTNPRQMNSYEVKVADRIRLRRQGKNVSQSELAEAVGVSFQQYQKNEMGKNRISVGRLVEIAKILGTTPHDLLLWDNQSDDHSHDFFRKDYLDQRMGALWQKVQNIRYRKAILFLLKVMIEESSPQLQGDKMNKN